MKSVSTHTKKPERSTPAPEQQPTGEPVGKIHGPPLSPCEDPDIAGGPQSDSTRLRVESHGLLASIRPTAQSACALFM